MIVVSATEFRSNQSKYIDCAYRGEEVVLTSKRGNVRLTPTDVSASKQREQSEDLDKVIAQAREENRNGKTLKFNNAADAQKWMQQL